MGFSNTRSRRRLSSRRVPPACVVFSVGRPIETPTDDHSLGPHGVSAGFSRLLRQKTDRNPLWMTILSVLTASPPDWRFSQVSGECSTGEEVHEESSRGPKLLLLCFREEFGDSKITVFQLSTEAPAPVSSRSNYYFRLSVRTVW
ncbi:hypothetical protein F2Q69_00061257 [Brassica cretica]|uniref:Uncharacterized protein n=1 Tax=Brassica cretica TaxID=69181 RepID=A0A8S9RB16_BRACR|nr:hypothetical protein F2Q69_00061257 [Brassica cretica]